LSEIERVARERRAIVANIGPGVAERTATRRKLLKARGWRASPEQIQFADTLLVDLRQSEDELLSAVKSKW
jgi:hypothetical protein